VSAPVRAAVALLLPQLVATETTVTARQRVCAIPVE
jgi:hypothetical protein